MEIRACRTSDVAKMKGRGVLNWARKRTERVGEPRGVQKGRVVGLELTRMTQREGHSACQGGCTGGDLAATEGKDNGSCRSR